MGYIGGEAHMRATVAGGRGKPGRQAGHPGAQDRPDHDALQCARDWQSGGSGEPDSKLTRNSREHRSTIGGVTRKHLKVLVEREGIEHYECGAGGTGPDRWNVSA